MAIREIYEGPRRQFAHELRVRSHRTTGDRSAKRQTKYTCFVPQPHSGFEVVGRRGDFGESFQLFRILMWRNCASLVCSVLDASSASKGDISRERSHENG